jgi:hypothetical protein
MRTLRRLAAASGLLVLANCSTSATIYRAGGPPYEAQIVQSKRDKLVVSGHNGSNYEISGHDVAVIDHPGNVHLTVGAISCLLGTGMFFLPNANDEGERQSRQVAGTVYGLVGLPFLLWGAWAYHSSTSASAAFENAPLQPVHPGTAPTLPPPVPPAQPKFCCARTAAPQPGYDLSFESCATTTDAQMYACTIGGGSFVDIGPNDAFALGPGGTLGIRLAARPTPSSGTPAPSPN